MRLRDSKIRGFYLRTRSKLDGARGEVDVLVTLLMMDIVDEQKIEAIERSVIRTGIQSIFTFETTIREKYTFVVEFAASEKELGGTFGGPLSISKILYYANFSDWFSAVANAVRG